MSSHALLHTSASRSKTSEMSESQDKEDNTASPQTPAAPPPSPAHEEGKSHPSGAPRAASRPSNVLALVALLFALAAAGLAAALWYDTRSQIVSTRQELTSRLHGVETAAADARRTARDARETAREAQAKSAVLESKLAEAQSREAALQAMYQELSRTHDEWVLSEVDQVLRIAQQQLELSGNVHAALLALQLANSQLAGSGRAQFMPIRRALTHDIEALKAFPSLDIPGMALELDGLARQVHALPLEFGVRASASARAVPAPQGVEGYLKRFGEEVWAQLRQLLIVRRMTHPEPPLLPPTQAYFLRQNLTLQLLNARLSLLLRDQKGYSAALRNAQDWIERYFNIQAKPTVAVLAQLKQLASASLDVKLPSISDSLDAVRRFKAQHESVTP